MYKMNLFAKNIRERILMVQVPEDFPYDSAFDSIFKKYFADVGMISMESIVKGELIELIFSVTMKSRFNPQNFLKEMRKINDNQKVTLIEGQQQVDL
jgi:hypothetical protein